MVVVRIHHVQLAMPPGEEKRAREFYQGILGIPEVAKPQHLQSRGGVWFENGELRVHLGVEQEFRPNLKAHPAFIVSDLNALLMRCRESGVKVAQDQPLSGFIRAYVSDPFGNRIELMQVI